jgi:hypothetical protein
MEGKVRGKVLEVLTIGKVFTDGLFYQKDVSYVQQQATFRTV